MPKQQTSEEATHPAAIIKKIGYDKGEILSFKEFLKIYRRLGIDTPKDRVKKLLEIGCGRGVHSINFARMGYRVTGIDISLPALKVAQDRAKKHQVKPQFFLQNACQINLPNDCFDLVVFMDCLHHFYYSNYEKVILEAGRLLKKKGVLILFEPNSLNPYTFLSFAIPHFFKKYLPGHFRYFEEVVTVNERALNPFKVKKLMARSFQIVSFRFLAYTAVLAERRYKTSKIFQLIRRCFSFTNVFLPAAYRYDHFGLKLIKR